MPTGAGLRLFESKVPTRKREQGILARGVASILANLPFYVLETISSKQVGSSTKDVGDHPRRNFSSLRKQPSVPYELTNDEGKANAAFKRNKIKKLQKRNYEEVKKIEVEWLEQD